MNKHKVLRTFSNILFVVAVVIQAGVITILNGWRSIWEIVAFMVLAISAAASLLANYVPASVSCVFSPEDWKEQDSRWQLLIGAEKYGLGEHSIVFTYRLLVNGNYEQVVMTNEYCENGDIILKTDVYPDFDMEAVITYIDGWKTPKGYLQNRK